MEGARFREAPFETMSSSAEQRLKPPSLARGGPRMLSVSKSNRRTQISEEGGREGTFGEYVITIARSHNSPGEDFLSKKEHVSSEA